jgi:fibronectin type 3 domain-containing protein
MLAYDFTGFTGRMQIRRTIESTAVMIELTTANSGIVYTAAATVNAGSFVVGTRYVILTAGNTSFTAVGAANNTAGTSFVATAAGSGTGTAYSPGGELTINMTAVQTAALSTSGVYDLEIINSASQVSKLLKGAFTLLPEVTR